MNISGTNINHPCFTSVPSQAHHHMYSITTDHQEIASSSLEAATTTSSSSESHVSSILYNFSLLKEKVQHVQSLMSIFISPDHQNQPPESASIAFASMGSLVQEIIVNASSMMLTCQQMYNSPSAESSHHQNQHQNQHQHQQQAIRFPEGGFSQLMNFGINRNVGSLGQERGGQSFSSTGMFDWYGNNVDSCNSNIKDNTRGLHIEHNSIPKEKKRELLVQGGDNNEGFSTKNDCDIIELDAADLLAKYTHYCQVCGKGFKRDANLRMHMRAHGDEYKSAAALSNPLKKNGNDSGNEDISMNLIPRKYSCPHEGCRWNQKHAKFQPLKSIICVKNHYKRSHCPKMYVCKRCNRKQFSILSDLRTHEKHCGNLKWQCSCGTTFSRKDKLMGHVSLFVGHTPLIHPTTRQ